MGTPLYVPPEMIENIESGAFTDLWSLGVIIFEMAFGHTPFQGECEQVVFDKICNRSFSWPMQK